MDTVYNSPLLYIWNSPIHVCWGLASGLPELQIPNCNSLPNPKKPIFVGEISGNTFVFGRHFGAHMKMREDAQLLWVWLAYGCGPCWAHCATWFLNNSGAWRYVLLHSSSWPLAFFLFGPPRDLLRTYWKAIFFLLSFGTLIWSEIRLFHGNWLKWSLAHPLWNKGCFSETAVFSLIKLSFPP